MKNFKKIIMLICCLTMTFALTGCGTTKELKNAYNKMKVGSKDNQVNGYTLNIRLFGIYNEKKVNETIRVSNYMNDNFKVAMDDYTYYLIDGKKYKTTSDDKMSLSTQFSSSMKNESEYSEIEDEIPFVNTDRYLVPLKSVKADDEPLKETIGETEYSTYTYSVKKSKAQKLLADTSLANEKLKGNVPAKVWISSDGYVYKIEYDISAGYKSTNSLILTLYYSGVDNASDIVMDTMTADHIELGEE